MEPVLADLELDLREIKYLLDILSREPDSMLQKVAIRRVRQMQTHLGVLLQEIEEITTKEEIIIEKEKEEIVHSILPVESAIEQVEEVTEIHNIEIRSLGDRVKPAADLKSSFTLNDRFLYSRELFQGDMEYMDNVLFQISQMESIDNVHTFLASVLKPNEEDETYQNFMERIRKYFD